LLLYGPCDGLAENEGYQPDEPDRTRADERAGHQFVGVATRPVASDVRVPPRSVINGMVMLMIRVELIVGPTRPCLSPAR
jgi:hypothetical protein